MQATSRSNAPTTLTLTIQETAQELRLSPLTVRRWIKAGRLRGVLLGKRWRVPRDELTRLLAG